jgi:translocation and assembly module TamB
MAEGELRADPAGKPALPARRRRGSRPGGDRPGGRRRWPWILGGLLVLPFALLAVLLLALQTGPGQRLAGALAEASVEGLQIGELAGAPPFDTRLREVSLRDSEGVWLRLDEGRLTLRPWALLGGTLDVTRLQVGTLEVARAPAAETPPEEDGTAGAGLPGLPFGLRVQDLAVERLALGAPLLGERLELGISGRLAARDTSRVETALSVERLDGEGSVTASAVFEPEARRLEAQLDAQAPAGGLASRLSGLPGEPPLAVSLEGSGPLEGWRGDWRIDAGAAVQAEGALEVTGLQPPALRLSGQADVAGALPEDLRALAAPAVAFAISGRYGETASLEIERLGSEAVALFGSASADMSAETLEADLSLEILDPGAVAALATPLELGGGRLRAHAEGSLEAPKLSVSATADGVRLPPFAAETLTLDLQGPAGLPADLVLDAEVSGLSGPPDAIAALGDRLTLFARAQASTESMRLDKLTLETPALTANGDGAFEFAGPRGDLALRLAYPGLQRLRELAGVELSGGLEAELYGSLAADGAASAMLTGDFAELGLGIPEAEVLLGPSPSLWAEARVTEDGALELSSVSLEGPGIGLSGQGSLDGETLAAGLTARLPDLARLQQAGLPLAGAASLDLSAAGTLDAPELTAELTSEGLEAGGTPLAGLSLQAETRGLPPELAGRVELETGTPAGAVRLASGIAVGAETLELGDLRLGRGGDTLSGRLAMPLSGPPAQGQLALRIEDLSTYGGLVPDLAGGSVSAQVTLSAAGGGQAAQVDARARDVRLSDGTRIAAAELEARLRDLLGALSLQANAQVSGLSMDTLSLERVMATADGTLEDGIALDLDAAGERREAEDEPLPLGLSAAGRLALAEEMRLELDSLRATYGELQAQLRQPAQLVYGPQRLRVQGLALAFNQGELDLSAELGGGQVEARMTARDLPLGLAEAAGLKVPLEGMLQASAQVSGPLPRPSGRFELRTEDLHVEKRLVGDRVPLDLEVTGRLNAGRLDAEAQLSGFAEENLRASASLPLLVRNDPPGVELPRGEPIEVTSAWSGKLAPIVGLLPVDVVRIEGDGELDLSIQGTLDDPQASGRLAITDGLYENYTLGTLLRPFTLRLEGEGSRLVLREFEAQDPGGGGMSVSGWLDLAGEVPSFDVSAQLDDLDVARRDDLQVVTDAELSLSGDLDRAALEGSVTLERGDISLAAEVPASVPTLDVTEINTGRPAPPEEEEQGGQGLAFLSLDVELSIPGQLFIRGRGLDSEWKGQFSLTGTAANPSLRGELQPVRGAFDLAGKQFQLQTGRISFSGQDDFDPSLDLTTVYEEEGFTARINVTGPASAPEINLSSSPPLPNDEILARILFGQSTARLSAGQALQVAQAAATLAGGGGGVMDYARNTLGVDVLSFAPGTSDSELGSLEAGKYLSDDVFVGVRQGATPGSSGAVVEWEILPSLKLESQVGTGAEDNNVGVKWEWDY